MNPTEKLLKEVTDYIQAHATPGMTEEDINRLTQEFMTEYNSRPFSQRYGIGYKPDEPDADDYVTMAEQASSPQERRKYLQKALALDPENLDAMTGLAMTSTTVVEELLSNMEEVVKKGTAFMERDGYLPDDVGHFWGILETRPYMRALSEYSQLLLSAGMFRRSAGVMEEMLRLCPEDNIGIRAMLISVYAGLEEKDKALRLYNTYHEMGGYDADEIMADSQMVLPLVALFYKLGEWKEAERFLKALGDMNKGTMTFFRKGAANPESAMETSSSPYGLVYGSIDELTWMFSHSTFLYCPLAGFFPWGLRVLKGSGSSAPTSRGIGSKKKTAGRKKKR